MLRFLSPSHALQLDMIVIGLGDFYNIKLEVFGFDVHVPFVIHAFHAETVMAQKLLAKTLNI